MREREGRPSASAQAVTLARAHLHWMGAIDDPWAHRWLTPGRRALARLLRRWPLRTYGRSPSFAFLAARTSFFDRAVTQALDAGARQVVIVGAGYDARAWRLARPGVRFFEVDHPATQADKRRLAPTDGAVFVPADLVVDDLRAALPAAGFEAGTPAVFIVEGLTMYLTEDVASRLFADLAALAAPGSHLAANFAEAGGGSVAPGSRLVAHAVRLRWRLTGEPTHYWATGTNLAPLLSEAGWTPSAPIPGPTLAATHLAADTPLATTPINPKMLSLTAHRSDGQAPAPSPIT